MNTGPSIHGKIAAGGLLVTVVFCMGATSVVAEADAWVMKATPQTLLARYSGSELRDTLFNAGFFIAGDYFEKAGFTAGYNYSKVKGKESNAEGFDSVEEHALYLSGKWHRYPDSLPGKLTLRLDTYGIQDKINSSVATDPAAAGGSGNNGNGQGNNTGASSAVDSVAITSRANIGVVNPIIGFINYAKTYALDLGYAFSHYDYEDRDSYQVHQLSPTFGFALGGQANWLQLRGFFIHLSDDSVAEGESDSAAVEMKWTHYFSPRSPLSWHAIGVNLLAGKRFLAVDPDAAAVFSLADQQTGSVALNSVWKPGERTSLMLQLGYDRFKNLRLSNDYSSGYVYFNLSQQW